MQKLAKILDKFTDFVGYTATLALILMLLNVFYDVLMRYFFRAGSIGMQEMEWHLFTIVFMFGISYTLKENGHVRVDMFYDNMKPKSQAIVNILGSIFFIIPFALLIIKGGYHFALESYNLGEMSGDPGGLPYRWIIKSVIGLSFVFLILTTISFIIKNLQIIVDVNKDTKNGEIK